jgi:hypothetical protein
LLGAVLGLCVGSSRLLAASVNWTGAAGSQDWHTAANWLENVVPKPADDVLIGRSPAPFVSVVLASDASAQSLVVENGHLLDVNANLGVSGDTTLGFSSIGGTGTLLLLGDTLISGNASVSTATFDLDGDPALSPAVPAVEIAPGAALSIGSSRFSAAGDPGDFTGRLLLRGDLNVTGLTNWTLSNTAVPGRTGTLELAGGTVSGAHITNHGVITGHGTIATLNVINNSAITASGGTLVLSTLSFPDIDGFGPKGEMGVVNAIDGDVRITTNQGSSHRFNGTLNIGPGRTFSMDFFGLNNSGVINLPAGARYAAPGFSQTDTGTLNLAINGIEPAEKGMVVASGIVTVGGTLNLNVGPGITLSRGQGVRLMTAQTVSGAFSTVTGIDQAQRGHFVYADNRGVGVGALALALAQPGDANFDGRVDSGDLLTVVPFFNNIPPGVNAAWGQGDFEEDGDVDSRDLLAASPFYNQGLYVQFIDSPSAGLAAAAAPRPAAAPLLGRPLIPAAAGSASVHYDAASGRLTLYPGDAELALFVLRSDTGLFDPDAVRLPGEGPFTIESPGELSQFFFTPWGDGGWELGAVLPPGLSEELLAADLTALGGALGKPIFALNLVHTPAVPEPGALLLLGASLIALRYRHH